MPRNTAQSTEGATTAPWHTVTPMDQIDNRFVRPGWWGLSDSNWLLLQVPHPNQTPQHQKRNSGQSNFDNIQPIWTTKHHCLWQWTPHSDICLMTAYQNQHLLTGAKMSKKQTNERSAHTSNRFSGLTSVRCFDLLCPLCESIQSTYYMFF